MKKRHFTLMELLFTVSILIILIGISWVSSTKVLRAQTAVKRNAEIVIIKAAIEQHKLRFGNYPEQGPAQTVDGEQVRYLHFALELSDWVMEFDYNGDGSINAADYRHESRVLNINELVISQDKYILDPYEEKYQYYLDNNKFEVK